jgi:tetratricopeptide (TPR) repeat protein
MTGAKLGAIVTGSLVIMYVALLSNTAIALVSSDDTIARLIGALLFVFPIFAIWSIFKEFAFGIKIEKLGKLLEAQNGWPEFRFDVRPSGRPIKESADKEFDRFREKTQANPNDWRNWFALGLVYDAAADRARARACMRKAIKLHKVSS